jgi:hypothetical protein
MRTRLLLTVLIPLLAACGSSKGGGSTSTATSTSGSTSSSPSVASVALTWAASTGNPSGYYVEESGDGTTFTTVQTVYTNAATVASLTVGHTYYFRVRAYNAGGYSSYSNTFSVTP